MAEDKDGRKRQKDQHLAANDSDRQQKIAGTAYGREQQIEGPDQDRTTKDNAGISGGDDVDDPDTLATQLSLLVDGAYAAVLIRQDPAMMRPAIAAARTLLKAAGVVISAGEAKSSAMRRGP